MKGERNYLIVLVACLILYVIYELQKPKETDWSITYHFQDKIPFGTFVAHDLIKDLFEGSEADHAFNSLHGLQDEGITEQNQLIVANQIQFTDQDVEGLFDYLEKGHTIMLSATFMPEVLKDTLRFDTDFDEQIFTLNAETLQEALLGTAKTTLTLKLPGEAEHDFDFPAITTAGYFDYYDEDIWEPLAFNNLDFPVLLRSKEIGGRLLLSTTPIAFTNYFVLEKETSGYASALLSFFPEDEALTHNEYYQLGRLEPRSKIRFFLSHEALKWSIFLLIIATLLFMLFEAKRRQRIIPVIRPLRNSTLEFVSVLGRLHYRQSDHTKLAKKRLLYWKDFVRSHYNMRTDHLGEDFVSELSKKSGRRKSVIQAILDLTLLTDNGGMDEGELLVLEKLLNEFYDIK